MPWSHDEEQRFRRLEEEVRQSRAEVATLKRQIVDTHSAHAREQDQAQHEYRTMVGEGVRRLTEAGVGMTKAARAIGDELREALEDVRALTGLGDKVDEILVEQRHSAAERARRAGQDELITKQKADELEAAKLAVQRVTSRRTALVSFAAVVVSLLSAIGAYSCGSQKRGPNGRFESPVLEQKVCDRARGDCSPRPARGPQVDDGRTVHRDL